MTRNNQQRPKRRYILGIFPEAMELVEGGVLNLTDACLLSLLDSLYDENLGLPCYAGNAFIAKKMGGISDRAVRNGIDKLRKLGLVDVFIENHNKRYVRVIWPSSDTETMSEGRKHASGGPEARVRGHTFGIPLKGNPSVLENIHRTKNEFFGGGEMRGFNGKDTTPSTRTKKKPSPFDKMSATQLHQAVLKHTMTKPSGTISKSAQAFRLLREKDEVDVERIDDVLEWHCSHLRDKYEPKAYTGDDFRKKFLNIEAALHRAHPPDSTIVISDEAKKMVERLSMNGWKKGSIDSLPSEVQLSLDFVEGFRRQLIALRNDAQETGVGNKTNYLLKHLQALLDRMPMNWVEQWYGRLHRRLHSWEAWSGDLQPFRMTRDSKEFRNTIYAILQDYGGEQNAKRFTDYIMENTD